MIMELITAWAGMAWEITWGLALGFLLSGLIRAWVPASLSLCAFLWGRRQGGGHCH
ncbi:hypothetical protein [Halomonas borealis]|uniref:hypothetical protein n=1 Tax=Halomonas borealis TaxID=2508710 RepID=UPI0014459DB0|nr:hypothetical protein [Halomonas borealis]